jgi:hypothetical protein
MLGLYTTNKLVVDFQPLISVTHGTRVMLIVWYVLYIDFCYVKACMCSVAVLYSLGFVMPVFTVYRGCLSNWHKARSALSSSTVSFSTRAGWDGLFYLRSKTRLYV